MPFSVASDDSDQDLPVEHLPGETCQGSTNRIDRKSFDTLFLFSHRLRTQTSFPRSAVGTAPNSTNDFMSAWEVDIFSQREELVHSLRKKLFYEIKEAKLPKEWENQLLKQLWLDPKFYKHFLRRHITFSTFPVTCMLAFISLFTPLTISGKHDIDSIINISILAMLDLLAILWSLINDNVFIEGHFENDIRRLDAWAQGLCNVIRHIDTHPQIQCFDEHFYKPWYIAYNFGFIYPFPYDPDMRKQIQIVTDFMMRRVAPGDFDLSRVENIFDEVHLGKITNDDAMVSFFNRCKHMLSNSTELDHADRNSLLDSIRNPPHEKNITRKNDLIVAFLIFIIVPASVMGFAYLSDKISQLDHLNNTQKHAISLAMLFPPLCFVISQYKHASNNLPMPLTHSDTSYFKAWINEFVTKIQEIEHKSNNKPKFKLN